MATPLRTEQDWARQHPVPESTEEDMLLSLWNYPVAKSDLAPEHRAALDRFLKEALVGAKLSGGAVLSKTEIYLTGHASDTGDDAANETLSRQRAENVARFLLGRGLPVEQIRIDWSGSRDPVDRGTTGLAAARNRRVDVLKFTPSQPVPVPPTEQIIPEPRPQPKPQPGFKLPKPTLSGVTVERVVTIDIPTYRSPNILIGGKLEVTFKGKATDKGGGITGGVAFKPGGGIGAKAEAKIDEHIKAKVGVESDPNKPGITLKGGLEFDDVRFKPEVGLQAKDTFIYVNLTLVDRPFPDFEIDDIHVSGNITIKGKLEVAPGPAMLLRFGLVAVSVVLALLFAAAAAYVVGEARAEGLRIARLIAFRDGVAARIANELVGVGANVAFRELIQDWRRTEEGLDPEFIAGANEINQLLSKPDDREKWTALWKAKYAQDGNGDFTTLRQRVFIAIGSQNTEGTPEDAVNAANAAQ